MAKKLKIKVTDKKEDLLVETTQKSLSWVRRFQAPLGIGGAVIFCVAVLVVYSVELEDRSTMDAWEEFFAQGSDAPAAVYAGIAARYPGTSVEPWALLDQAHALSRSDEDKDKEEAIRIYEAVKARYPENPLAGRIAEQAIEGVRKEMAYSAPAPPPPEEEPAEEPPAPPEEEAPPGDRPTPPEEGAGTEENP